MPDPESPIDTALGRGSKLFADEEMEKHTTPEVRGTAIPSTLAFPALTNTFWTGASCIFVGGTHVIAMIDRMSSKISELGDVFSNQLADMRKVFNESVIQISKQNVDSEARVWNSMKNFHSSFGSSSQNWTSLMTKCSIWPHQPRTNFKARCNPSKSSSRGSNPKTHFQRMWPLSDSFVTFKARKEGQAIDDREIKTCCFIPFR